MVGCLQLSTRCLFVVGLLQLSTRCLFVVGLLQLSTSCLVVVGFPQLSVKCLFVVGLLQLSDGVLPDHLTGIFWFAYFFNLDLNIPKDWIFISLGIVE